MAKRYKKRSVAKKGLPVFDKIALGLNIVAAILLLLSYLAPGTDPRDNSIIALLGFGYLILLAVNIVFIIYWIVRTKGYFALISGLSILAGFNMITANIGFQAGKKIDNVHLPETIRLMQYNVHTFRDTYKGDEIQSDVYRIVQNEQPDVICMEEYRANKLENGTTADSLKKIINSKYAYFEPFKIRNADSTGNAIFSKYPIIRFGKIPSPEMLFTRSIFADIQFGKKVIRIYCIHLAAVKIADSEKSKILSGEGYLDNSAFIGNKLSAAFVARSFQVSLIKRHMEDCPYPYIVTGDFNDTPNSFAVNEIGDGLKNAFKEKGGGFETTYYSKFPLHIDYIFASIKFDVLSYQSVDKELSDHKPLFSDLKLN